MKPRSVVWAANEYGYVVEVLDKNGQIIPEHSYSAGNHTLDSQSTVEPGGNCVSLEQIRKFADQTAHEKAAELKLSSVSKDTDLVEAIQGTYSEVDE